jgi:hypothetical protein
MALEVARIIDLSADGYKRSWRSHRHALRAGGIMPMNKARMATGRKNQFRGD